MCSGGFPGEKQKINVPFLQQDIESENVNVVKRLFKIQNINASTIRTVMVAHCRRHDNPDLLLDYEAQSQARRQKGQHHHQPLLFDLATSGSEEEEEQEEEEECQRGARSHGLPSPRLPQPTMSGLEHVIHVKNLFGFCFVFLAFSFFKFNFFCCTFLLPPRAEKTWGRRSWRLRPRWLSWWAEPTRSPLTPASLSRPSLGRKTKRTYSSPPAALHTPLTR